MLNEAFCTCSVCVFSDLVLLPGHFHPAVVSTESVSLYRVKPVAAGCIIGWDVAMPLMQCPPYQYTGTHFADLGRMTG